MSGTAYRFNPYSTPVDRWTDDKVAARRDMPTSAQGHIVQPRFALRDVDRQAQTERWREWSKRWPKNTWPIWLESWLEANPT
jgi:hypothetical protein